MPFFFLVASVGLFFSWINPRYEEIQEQRTELARLEDVNIKATKLEADRARLLATYEAIGDENEARLIKLLPDDVDNIQLLLDIKNAAATYGLVVKDISLSESKNDNRQTANNEKLPYGETKLGFSVEARYSDFVSFLRDIEQSLRLVDVRELGVSQDEEGYDIQKYELSVVTYWLKP